MVVWWGQFDDARVVAAIVFGTIHEGWQDGGAVIWGGGVGEHLAIVEGLHHVVVLGAFIGVEKVGKGVG